MEHPKNHKPRWLAHARCYLDHKVDMTLAPLGADDPCNQHHSYTYLNNATRFVLESVAIAAFMSEKVGY